MSDLVCGWYLLDLPRVAQLANTVAGMLYCFGRFGVQHQGCWVQQAQARIKADLRLRYCYTCCCALSEEPKAILLLLNPSNRSDRDTLASWCVDQRGRQTCKYTVDEG